MVPEVVDFNHLGGLGPKLSKMVPIVVDFDNLGGLGPKCFNMVPKLVDFDYFIWAATVRNGPKWSPKYTWFKPNGSESKLELSDLKC